MNCPRCTTSPLEERTREGVEIDICRSCRGVWLDRGELERFVEKAELGADYHEIEDRLSGDEAGMRPRGKGTWIRRLFD